MNELRQIRCVSLKYPTNTLETKHQREKDREIKKIEREQRKGC